MTDRRKTPRPKPGSTLRRVLDITYEQIRKTKEGKHEPTSKSN